MGTVVLCATCGTQLRENARFCDHVRFEAVAGAGERQIRDASVVHKYINGVHRVGERAHTGEVGQI
jgi:hypothetical protein